MDTDWAVQNQLPILPLKKPFRLIGFDGDDLEARPNVHSYVRCSFYVGDHYEELSLYLTDLGDYPIVRPPVAFET